VMDVALYHGTIDPDFSPRLDCCFFGMPYHDPVDLLPGLRGQRLDVLLQRRLLEPFAESDPAKGPEAIGVFYMKGQLPVRIPEENLDYRSPQNMLRAHPPGPRISPLMGTRTKVLNHHLIDGRMPVKNPADCLQLFGLIEILTETGRQQHLFLSLIAHLGRGLFLVNAMISTGWYLLNIMQCKKFPP